MTGIFAITSQFGTDSYAENTLLTPKRSHLIPRQPFKFLVYPQVVPSSGALAKRMCLPRVTSELTGEATTDAQILVAVPLPLGGTTRISSTLQHARQSTLPIIQKAILLL